MPFIPLSEAQATPQSGGFTPLPEERSLTGKVVRGLGRTVRAGVLGLTAIPNMLGDAVGLRSSETVRNALTKLGLPQAENRNERIAEDVAGGMAGSVPFVKVGELAATGATALTKKIGETLAARPGMQVASGATGAGAASTVREQGGGPGAQLAAGLAGAFVPALPAAAAAAARGAARGGEAGRVRMANNIDTFEEAGAGTPTVGQATEGRGTRAIESTLAKVPGGAGPMAAKAEAEAAGLSTAVEDMAGNLAPRTGAAPAGRQIKSGLEQFVDEFKGSSGKLYDELDKHIPKESTVGVASTRAALEKLNADIPGAPALSKWFKNAKIQGIEGALDKDAPATQAQPIISQILGPSGEQLVTGQTAAKVAGLPYEALKKLRTLVGNEMADSGFGGDVPRSKWKPLYAALSKDMQAAAESAGPKAQAAFVRANNFHRAGMTRLDDVLGPIMAKGDPEDIFRAATSGTKEGATTISGVMKSLPEESRKVVASTMLRRLGVATPGKQNELGEAFSTDTFLTNWNKLHPDSKRVLFAPLEPGTRSDLDKIAKVASNVREGSKVFANPSGTTQGTTSTMTAGAFVISLLTGQWATAGAIAGTTGAANIGARAMTSPKIVHWLAESTKAPVEQLPAQLNQLFQQSLYMKGDERREVRQFVKDARAAIPGRGLTPLPAAGAQQ